MKINFEGFSNYANDNAIEIKITARYHGDEKSSDTALWEVLNFIAKACLTAERGEIAWLDDIRERAKEDKDIDIEDYEESSDIRFWEFAKLYDIFNDAADKAWGSGKY